MTTDHPSSQPVTLPRPENFPDADVIIFDGECGFCRRSVGKIQRLDGKNRIAFLPAQDERVPRDYPDIPYDRLMSELVLVDQRGVRHGGAAAFRYLSRRLPCLWWLAPLMHLPLSLPLWSAAYRFVAKRRYLLGGKRCETGSCHLD